MKISPSALVSDRKLKEFLFQERLMNVNYSQMSEINGCSCVKAAKTIVNTSVYLHK